MDVVGIIAPRPHGRPCFAPGAVRQPTLRRSALQSRAFSRDSRSVVSPNKVVEFIFTIRVPDRPCLDPVLQGQPGIGVRSGTRSYALAGAKQSEAAERALAEARDALEGNSQ